VLAEDQKNRHGPDAVQSRLVTLVAHEPTVTRPVPLRRSNGVLVWATPVVALLTQYRMVRNVAVGLHMRPQWIQRWGRRPGAAKISRRSTGFRHRFWPLLALAGCYRAPRRADSLVPSSVVSRDVAWLGEAENAVDEIVDEGGWLTFDCSDQIESGGERTRRPSPGPRPTTSVDALGL
jgi:hypothetical protein